MAQLLKFTGWAAAIALSLGSGLPALAQAPAMPTPVRSLLSVGATGPDVQDLQAVLRLMGYYGGAINGQFNEETLIGVTRFQQAAGLSQDGIVGAATWTKLLPPAPGESPVTIAAPPAPATPPVATTPAPAPSSTAPLAILRKGCHGRQRGAVATAPAGDRCLRRSYRWRLWGANGGGGQGGPASGQAGGRWDCGGCDLECDRCEIDISLPKYRPCGRLYAT
ncbi:MAG: peptidoglycan-binding protein [Alkalinema sp. RU_4_3]|nr:peptidoglycan-binding protein [Alkalinema sp. RU_4_3]